MSLKSIRSLISTPLSASGSQTIARNFDEELTGADIEFKIDFFLNRVENIESTHILVNQSDGSDLLASLLAIWRLNKTAVLSTNTNMLHSLSKSLNDELRGVEVPSDDKQSALVLYTSGSTGNSTAITKTFEQLDSEIQILEKLWGDLVDDSMFVTTVSRHHMYGLPLGLLWPVLRGSPFFSKTLYYSQSLANLLPKYPVTLVSSPVQLDGLPNNSDCTDYKNQLNCIFSAGAPLSKATAERCLEMLIPVTEIYGSTETGVIACKEPASTDQWQPLPDINISVDDSGRIIVNSPALDPPNSSLKLSDKIELNQSSGDKNQRFSLQGRTDRIAKVGGKRISLSKIESSLEKHPWVASARALLLEERKSRVGAVVALTPEGQARLIDQPRLSINRQLARSIADSVDFVAIPRYWRYVSQIPQDAQGKSPMRLLATLFSPNQQPRLPEIIEQSVDRGNSEARLLLRISPTLFWFTGHFPGSPVLPGVVQIQWASDYGREVFPEIPRFLRLEGLKFQQIIQPQDLITLQLKWDSAKNKLYFRFYSPERTHSSGRIVFTPEDQTHSE